MGHTRAASFALAAAAWAIAAPAVRADDAPSYRATIDRAELEPAAIGGQRLRVYLSAVAVQGQLLDLSEPKSIKAIVGGSELKAPYALGAYGSTTADTAIVFVVEATAAYADVLPVIADALDSNLLGAMSDKTTQIAFLPYGDAAGTSKLATLKVGRGKLAQLASDGSTEDPALLETVERALALLKRATVKPADPNAAANGQTIEVEPRPLRKIIVVIGDGRDRTGDHERVAKVGKRAAAEGVRIHALGFSPTDTRRPMLLLGELSKRSLGTFRWVRGAKAESWAAAAQQLRDEVVKQDVLTFFLPEDADVAGKHLKIQTVGRTETLSNEITIPRAVTCGGSACDSGAYCAADHCVTPSESGASDGILGLVFKLIGGAAALLIVLVGIGYLLSKRKPASGTGDAPVPARGVIAPGAHGADPLKVAAAAMAKAASRPATNLPSRPPAPAPAVLANGKPAPVMFLMGGARDGERLHLRHGFTIGKATTCDLVIDDGFTSAVHAQIGMDTFGNCRLYDNNSTNGIYVNGVRVAEYALSHGVTVKIGSTEMRFLAQ